MTSIREHGLLHPTLKDYIANKDWDYIATWYSSVPESGLNNLSSWMSLQDRANFYSLGLVREWYSDFCLQLINNTNLNPVLVFDQEVIIDSAKDLIGELNEYGLVAMNLTEAVQNLLRRYSLGATNVVYTLQKLLICLVSSRVFSEHTGLIYFVDLQPMPRWITLGLEDAPTAQECQAELDI
jgi:hypothetical protein